jgi:SAM-dependent methyltransferase
MLNRIRSGLSYRYWSMMNKTPFDWGAFTVTESAPPETPNDLETIFWENDFRAIDKWHHYFPIYDRYLSAYRGRPVKVLEIGVQSGGSIAMWRTYFGPEAVLFGIDIDPRCAAFDGEKGQIRIGSQADAGFLRRVVDEMGGVDIILDDGSHDSNHLRVTFETLYPLLSEGGLFMAEDLHCCYWPNWTGGYRRPASFIEYAKRMVDDMHHWYHGRARKTAPSPIPCPRSIFTTR